MRRGVQVEREEERYRRKEILAADVLEICLFPSMNADISCVDFSNGWA